MTKTTRDDVSHRYITGECSENTNSDAPELERIKASIDSALAKWNEWLSSFSGNDMSSTDRKELMVIKIFVSDLQKIKAGIYNV